jgi:signal transduction histidine kinase
VSGRSPGPTPGFDRRLLDAVVGVADGLELESTLHRIVTAAAELTAAPYAALGVLGEDGLHRAFVHTGIDADTVARIGPPPRGHGVLGHITRVGRAVRVEELGEHPSSTGFPAGHPPMHSFLGVPVGIGERVVGNLYLADKAGGFTAEDEDVLVALAAAAAVAVDNAQLYEDARRREAWVGAAQEVATAMLSGADEDEALELVAARAREVADAEVAGLVLPGRGGDWVLEVIDGEGAADLFGVVMPDGGRAMSVIAAGTGLRADLSTEPRVRVPQLRRYGPTLYAPMVADGETLGVLMVLRAVGGPPFTAPDLVTAERFAGQAALALRLAEARRRAEDAEILEERQRIARDLHDLVVQELFALGMRLSRIRPGLTDEAGGSIDASLESLERVILQIRATIRSLRDPEEPTLLDDRVLSEATRARVSLGFPPEVCIDGDLRQVPVDLADDVVAVIREGLSNAARHSAASHVTVTVTVTDDQLLVLVTDDGVGMPDGRDRRSGLLNLAERAERHGGGFAVVRAGPGGSGETRGGTGTTLRWQVPRP